ncbi:MAG: hypothetical protein AAGG44_20760, partial [Planctomycetota bacterium]
AGSRGHAHRTRRPLAQPTAALHVAQNATADKADATEAGAESGEVDKDEAEENTESTSAAGEAD